MVTTAAVIKGITVELIKEVATDTDRFGNPITEKTTVNVDNVLIKPLSTDEQITDFNFYGKKSVYELCIPKGDTNEWENRKVNFFGKTWLVISPASETIDAMTPLEWNKHFKVALYE